MADAKNSQVPAGGEIVKWVKVQGAGAQLNRGRTGTPELSIL